MMKDGNSTEQKMPGDKSMNERKMENGNYNITAFKGKDCIALRLIIQMYSMPRAIS